jgi:hypothetical protein
MSGHIFKIGFAMSGKVEAKKAKTQKGQKQPEILPFLSFLPFLLPSAFHCKKLIL